MIDINTNIRIAVAGCGSAGRNNIRLFSGIDDAEVTVCCDNDEELAEFTAREYGLKAYYTDIREMLETEAVDALVVAVPDGEHLEAALEAFRQGVNVFCENPLASDYAGAIEMTRAARESGLVAMLNYGSRNMRIVSEVVKTIESGRLGRIKYFEASFMQNRLDSRILDDPREEKRLLWRLSAAAGSAGVIGELGSFLYDFAGLCCGELSGVSASIRNISGFDEVEEYQELDLTAGDTFVSQLDFKGGAAGVVRGSWVAGGPHQQITLSAYGEDGSISFDTGISENEYSIYTAESYEKTSVSSGSDAVLYENFISAVKGEAVPMTGFDHGLKIQYYLEQSRLSSEGGLRLDLGDDLN